MMLPGWNSPEAVKRIASSVEVGTLVFWSLLVVFETLAYFSSKKLQKTFNVLALIAFAVAVSGEITEHKYEGRKESLYDAQEQALVQNFKTQLQKANADASQAQQRARAAEQETEKLKVEQAFRKLTNVQKDRLIALLKPYAPQQLYFLCAPDSESTEYANAIESALNAAGWKTTGPPYNWGAITHYGIGVWVLVYDVKKPAPRGAVILQHALKTIGIDANGGSFFMVGENGLALYVGLRPRSTPH